MIEVVKQIAEPEVRALDKADENLYYTLETGSGRPFMLVRANANVGDHSQEDQWHWVGIGKVKNRKTGLVSFDEAMNLAISKPDNVVFEHSSQQEAFLYLADLAKSQNGSEG